MNNAADTIEDCLDLLLGFKGNHTFEVESSDFNFLASIAKQTHKGTGLTDRQYNAVKQKLENYRSQFESREYNLDRAVERVRLPLRSIDRSRWIRIVERENSLYIGVRFVFQKTLISKIEQLKKVSLDSDYDAEHKIHYFDFTEINAFKIISLFKDVENFEIQPQLWEFYEKLEHMKRNKKDYVPGVYNYDLKNLSDKCLDYAISSIGQPNQDNLYRYYDQKELFGLKHFDDQHLSDSMRQLTSLSQKIANRSKLQILVDSKAYTVDQLAESVLELYRFPLLVVLNKRNCYNELSSFHRAFHGIIHNESCSVLFRQDTNNGSDFNQYIHANNLNNRVDSTTKIVYISSDKIPKPLLRSDWAPSAAVTTYCGYNVGKVSHLLNALDLVIHYDDVVSPWKRHLIEKI